MTAGASKKQLAASCPQKFGEAVDDPEELLAQAGSRFSVRRSQHRAGGQGACVSVSGAEQSPLTNSAILFVRFSE